MKTLILFVLFLTAIVIPAIAEETVNPPESPYIEVKGTANISIPPDYVEFEVMVQVREKELDLARNKHTELVNKITSIAKAEGIETADIKTDFLRVQAIYNKNNTGRNLNFYLLRNDVILVLKNKDKYAKLFAALLNLESISVTRVEFKVNNPRLHMDKARAMAITAAKEKASALTNALGQQVGKAIRIIEEQTDDYSLRLANVSSNETYVVRNPGDREEGPTVNPANIDFTARVKVYFELK